jgi:hypothetical protein
MKKELLKKMKYEMPGKPKQASKGPMAEDMEVEISLEGEEPEMEETGMPEMEVEGEEMMAEGEDMEEMETPDLSLFSDEELQAELDKRMAPAKGPAKMA